MNITFLERELKANKLEIAEITFYYLLAIARTNPFVWKQFMSIMNSINKEAEK
jgi:hypothetical protein